MERPSSVVKELVENSLDAGAGRIDVEVREGGKTFIQVTDNGEGMDREDALLAFERHATSKIDSERDLLTVMSLGFRGEALPSIARVSAMEVMTKTSSMDTGVRIAVKGGSIQGVEDSAGVQGTTMTVENLFYNMPARKKFLRSESAEYQHVWDVLSRYLLSRPRVYFVLVRDGRDVIAAPPVSDMRERAMAVVGDDAGRNLYEWRTSSGAGRLYALASGPQVHRASSGGLYIFVNGRYVKDRSLSHAVSSAYSRALAKGRWPVCILFLDVAPQEVDANVHPGKIEVRFKRPREVYDLVFSGLGGFLTQAPWLGGGLTSIPAPAPGGQEGHSDLGLGGAMASAPAPATSPAPSGEEAREPQAVYAAKGVQAELPSLGRPVYSSLTIIGQSRDSYIIAQSPEGLILIDQHAAAERVCFVRLKEAHHARRPIRQLFLVPQSIDLFAAQTDALVANGANLSGLGIDIEPFGRTTVLLTSVPAPLVDTDYSLLLSDIAEALPDRGGREEFERKLDDVLSRMACHSSIRAGRPLHMEEMERLLRELDEVEFSAFCPHGRPVAHLIAFSEIESMFGRR